jgi:hypothetical protein
MDLGGFSYDLGLGIADSTTRAVPTDPMRDYVSAIGGLGLGYDDAWDRDDRLRGSLRWHGLREYEAMYNTPAAGSSINALRAAVLSGGIGLLPAIRPTGSATRGGQQGGTGADAEKASRIAESNRRTLNAWETPLDLVLWEMLEALYLGHVLAEVGADRVSGGPDAGMLAITSLRTLPRGNYRFLVDRAGRVARIGARAIEGEWAEFEPDGFAWLTWDPHRGDPRGRSCFRMAHYHWRMLMDLWPEIYKGWKQFGVPMMYGTTAPGARMQPDTNRDGTPAAAGRPVTPEYVMARRMIEMVNGSRIAGPAGSSISILESAKDSSVAASGVTILEGQIVRSVLLQIRATVEAQHGSKADSQTGQDILGTLVRFVRKWLERFVRSLLIRQNTWNYGPDDARRLTPLVNLGEHEHQDFAAEVGAVAALLQSGFFQADQLSAIDEKFGFQQRQAGGLRIGPSGPIPNDPPPAPGPAALPAPASPPAKEAA